MEKPVTVWRALSKMWELVAKDRWVIFAAFSALIVAAVSTFFLGENMFFLSDFFIAFTNYFV